MSDCCEATKLMLAARVRFIRVQVTQSFRYPAPITALGMSSDSRTLAVGMANGTLSVKQLKPPPSARAVARGAPCLSFAAYLRALRVIRPSCIAVYQQSLLCCSQLSRAGQLAGLGSGAQTR